jgi:hypothetical protein
MGPVTPAALTRMSIRPNVSAGPGHQTLDGRLVGDVRGDHERAPAERGDLARERLERRRLAGGDRQARALTGERQADIPAHPLGGARHDGDPVRELHASSPSARSRALSSAVRSAGGP